MATVSVSLSASSKASAPAAMSSKRAPLASNPNAANSPLRAPSILAGYAKPKRSFATVQREEPYGQPPPVKKQALENGAQRAVRSPSKPLTRAPAHIVVPRNSSAVPRPIIRERSTRTATTSTTRATQEVDTEKEVWKKHHRAKFPKMVFYFESIPDDIRAKLTKRVTYLGARQEPFFSIDVTHVVTTRTIPPEKPEAGDAEAEVSEEQEPEEQPQTINPSLLDRNTAARRRLLFDFRQASVPSQLDGLAKRNKTTRNNDVLHKAREMGKKIWSLDKFQSMLAVLLESETQSYSSRSASMRNHYGTKSSHEPNLFQLLHNERINGPSDRDPTAISRELTYFKGPYVYIWDMDEKQKPIMVREYTKVANKTDGEWPQFRSVGNGRCPFVEEIDNLKDWRKAREREKARLAKKEESVQILKAPEVPPMKPVTGKRTLTEMEDAHNRARAGMATETFQPIKVTFSRQSVLSAQNAFTSRAEGGRMFGGEPVASGIQNTITSAIRSQMISSTSGINGAKAGTSKEVHGLQRKVLQMAQPTSHDASSRRVAEAPAEVASSRSTLSRTNSKTLPGQDDDSQKAEKKAPTQHLKSKRDLKPGYCENCQDKFRDFDEHILSRKHRKFAENDDNWIELDALLAQLKRMPRFSSADSDDGEGEW
ncbi:g1 s regulator [Trichoderma arundinaceum]|uniref:G1 s regulator n=1 Tax=Trichoderma arundinaceum TaxID=490622 RepID=A0A395P023_TRIAR|nr:g1 s regulator [Trichoderma arundinaceum]